MKKVKVLALLLLLPCLCWAKTSYHPSFYGDYYRYTPQSQPRHILVVAHGMLGEDERAADVALRYLNRWKTYAEQYDLLVVAPVFDNTRFGNRGPGYGGYRNLLGRHVGADEFVHRIIKSVYEETTSRSEQFYLYGHSAGAQFANRYVVTHPDRVIRVILSAPGRYSYPTLKELWPYGAAPLDRVVRWDQYTETHVQVKKSLRDYALATAKVTIVVGEKDLDRQPTRPAHVGENRVELAHSWAEAMQENAIQYGLNDSIKIRVVPNVGHSSSSLTPACAEELFKQLRLQSTQ